MILLDTHVIVWFVTDDARLGRQAAARIGSMDRPGTVRISPISVWEAGMLIEKQRLSLDRPTAEWFRYLLLDPIVQLAPLDVAIAAEAGHLPHPIQGDLADRMLIATARALDCPLVTADRKTLSHAAAGHLEVVDARH